MRIEITELPEDKFRLDDLVESQLLLRLLKATDVREFVLAVNSLRHQEQLQLGQEIARLPAKLEDRVNSMLLNGIDKALEQPVSDEREVVQFIRVLKRLLETCFDSSFESYDRLLNLAEVHPSLEVMSEAVEVLVSKAKSKTQFIPRLTTVLRDFVRASNQSTDSLASKRFGQLSEEDQLRLQLFCKIHLYLLNPSKYPVREEELRPYFNLLRTRPYTWLLNLLQSVKSEQMSFIYRDVLDAQLSLEPQFHFEANTRYVHPESVNAEAMEIAVDREKAILVAIAHAPSSLMETPTALYFKFNLMIYKMYEQCVAVGDSGEAMPVNEEIETEFNNIVAFLLKIIKGFQLEFVVLTTDGEKHMTETEKLQLLEINLRALDEIIQKYNLAAGSKSIAEKDLLGLALGLVENLLRNRNTSSTLWNIFRKVLRLYRLLIALMSSNLQTVAVTHFPELLVRIIDGYDLPRSEYVLNEIFEFSASYLQPLLQKAGRVIHPPSPTFTRRMLDAYFESDYQQNNRGLDMSMFEENALEHYLRKEKSPHARATFNEFMIERLKVLETPEHSVIKLMENPKKRSSVVLQINKLLRVLDSTVIKLEPETSKLLTFRLMQYFILFEDQVRDETLAKIKKKLDFQAADAIYQQALNIVIGLLQKDPFGKMSMECLLREFGNELHDDWPTILQIFSNLHMVIFLNVFRKGDYSEASFVKIFKIVRLLCKSKSQIQQRLAKQLKDEGVTRINQLQLLASIKGLETTYGLLYSFFRRLKKGLAQLKVQQAKNQEIITLDEQINLIAGLKELFPILSEEASKHELILYIDSIGDVLYGCGPDNQNQDVLPLHFTLNLYSSFRDSLFRTVNTLNGLVRDKSKIHDVEPLRFKTLDNYLGYFRKTPEKFEEDIEIKFAQNVNKLLRLFILRPVATHMPFRYRGTDYADTSAAKMGLGMYVDQFEQLVKTLTMNNLELYSKCIRYFLQPNFFDNLLLNTNDRRMGRHNNRASRQTIEALLRMGINLEIARMAVSQIEEPEPELALEWINSHRDEIEILERAHVNRGIQQSNRRLSKQPEAGAIQEIETTALSDKMGPLLKNLIKDVLMPNMYSEYSDLIQNMFIEAIDRFEKDESRLKNYTNLSGITIDQFISGLTIVDGKVTSVNENRAAIQLNLLKSIIYKGHNKKDIRAKYLAKTFISDLLGLLEFVTASELNELKQKIIESGLSIVCMTMPNKKKEGVDRSKQIGGVLSVLLKITEGLHRMKNPLKRKVVQDLIIQGINKALEGKNAQTSSLSMEILIRLISEESIPSSTFEIIEAVLSHDEEFLDSNIESEVKSYFFLKRTEDAKLISVPKRSFLSSLEKYNTSPRFYNICKQLIRKQHERPPGGKKITNIVYNQQQHKFSESIVLKRPFIEYSPSESVRKVVGGLLGHLFSKGKMSLPHVRIVHQLLNRFPLLIPFVLNYPLDGATFIDRLVQAATQSELEMSTVMFFFCLNCPIVVQLDQQETLLSSYIQSKMITKLYDTLNKEVLEKKDCWVLLLLTNLLQLREINRMANFELSNDCKDSLRALLERLISKYCTTKEVVYIAEPLSLILKQATLDNLKSKYRLYEENRQGTIEDQIIPLQIMLSEGTGERRELMEELERTGEEMENDEENGQIFIQALERRLMNRYTQMFRRRATDRTVAEYLPIEVEEPKPAEQKPDQLSEPAQESKMNIEEPPKQVKRNILPNHQLLNRRYDYSAVTSIEEQKIEIPKDFSSFVEGESSYEPQPSKIITYDNTKNQALKARINVLASGLKETKPLDIMEIEPQPLVNVLPRMERDEVDSDQNDRARRNRRISIPFDLLMGGRRGGRGIGGIPSIADLLPSRLGILLGRQGSQIEAGEDELISNRSDDEAMGGTRRVVIRRFMGGQMERDRDREREIIQLEALARSGREGQQRERPPLEENEIERALEQVVVEPPKPAELPKASEEKKPALVNPPEPIRLESDPVLLPVVDHPLQPPAVVVPEVQEVQVPQQPVPVPSVVAADKMEVEVQEPPINPQPEAQNIEAPNLEKPPAEKMEVENPPPIVNELPPQPVAIEVEPPREPEAPVVVPPPAVEPQAPRQRPILEMLGLPQSFLRDNGFEEDLFDSLPESIQMEVLLPMMAGGGQQSQGQPRPPAPREDHKQDHPEIDQEYLQGLPEEQRRLLLESMEPRNLVSENLALLSEIEDPALRQSILIEATPEQLASFPQEIQAEAEMLRTRRLREIAAEFEEDDHNVEIQRSRSKKPKKPAVYPEINASLFEPVSEEAVKAALNILYWSFPKNYKPLLVQSLLENKRMQPKIITTLLYILRNPLNTKEFPNEVSYFKDDKAVDRDIKSPTSIVQGNILSVLLDLLGSSPYKDSKVMKEKISYDGLNGIRLEARADYSETEECYQPYIELLDYALDHSTELSAYLMEGVTDLPEPLIRKLVKKLYSSSLDDSFISNLKGLSENPTMAKIFEQEVTETHHPKISIYAHLLKYKFSVTRHLHKLHLKALASYKPEYNEFLNQIYRIYTLQDLKEFKQLGQYKSIHRSVIKYLLSRKCKLSEEPIYLIMSLPFLMDFETKKEIFHSQIKALNEQRYMGKLEIKVNRKDLFRKSYNQIMARTSAQLRARLCVVYDDEGAYDAGGLTRDWFLAISKEMFNRDYALFETSSSGNTYQPSSKSYVNPDHLKYFKFVGRVVGKALSERENVDAFFTRSFYKLILGQELELNDLEEQDYELHRSMQYYRANPVTDEFNFTYISHKFGVDEVKELIPGGRTIFVNEQNKQEWIRKMAEVRMRDEIQPQIRAFLEGFHELIPPDSIKFFDAKELELLISGLPNIDLDDLKNNIEYSGYTVADNIIRWFWEILETYDQEHLAQVIQFITGTSKIPAEGFKALKGMHGPQRISIVKSYEKNRLPQAHTCYNQLELPDYPSKAILEKNLEVLFKWGNEGFGFM